MTCSTPGCSQTVRARGLCSRCHTLGRKNGTLSLKFASIGERFWSKVEFGDSTECWPWRGSRFQSGYGNFRVKGGNVRSNRQAWELAHGRPVPPGLDVLHSCDNPPCCNPFHLTAGTKSQNQRERTERRPPSTQKLTVTQADEIRRRHAVGGVQQQELAQEYGVTAANICHLLAGRSFKT